MAQPAPLPPTGSPSPVPLALWTCGQPPTDPTRYPPLGPADSPTEPTLLPPALAERLLVEFTEVGDLVYDLDDGTVEMVAVDLGRRATRLATARHTRAALRVLPAAQRPLADVRLVEPDHAPLRMLDGPLGGLPDLAGVARLLVATHTHPDPAGRWLATRAANWLPLLAPGGLVAVVTCALHQADRLIDNAALVVAACEQAGLVYVQHIIALLVAVCDGQLVTSQHTAPQRLLPTTIQAVPPLQSVHADVLVFANPARPQASAVAAASGPAGRDPGEDLAA